MEQSEILRFKGPNTGIEVTLKPIPSSRLWDLINDWNDLSEIMQIVDSKVNKDEKKEEESGSIEGMGDRLLSARKEANKARSAVVQFGYKMIMDRIDGPIVLNETIWEPDTEADLEEVFPLLDSKKLSDMHWIITEYLNKNLPDQAILKNSDGE